MLFTSLILTLQGYSADKPGLQTVLSQQLQQGKINQVENITYQLLAVYAPQQLPAAYFEFAPAFTRNTTTLKAELLYRAVEKTEAIELGTLCYPRILIRELLRLLVYCLSLRVAKGAIRRLCCQLSDPDNDVREFSKRALCNVQCTHAVIEIPHSLAIYPGIDIEEF